MAPTPAHTLDAAGTCVEACAHPDHADAPIVVTMHQLLEDPLRDWLNALGVQLAYFPSEPGENGGMRHYVAVLDPYAIARITGQPAAANRMRPAPQPRLRRQQ